MSEETCTFSYIAARDYAPKTATGVERTWFDLKLEFGRTGEGLPGAKYYKKISDQGPQLFAVKFDQSVWYHDQGIWHRYQTATDIKYGKLCLENLSSQSNVATTSLKENDYDFCIGVSDEPITPDNYVHVPYNFQN